MPVSVGIDIGGTFTDFVAVDRRTDQIIRTKTLSDPAKLVESFTDALKQLGIARDEVELLIHGTTAVTNLIIERTGAKVGLITTKGFRDILEIGWSFRPETYSLQTAKVKPFVPRPLRFEVAERTGALGEERIPLDEDAVQAAARSLINQGAEVIVVSFLHSYANKLHEERARQIVAEVAPNVPCVISSEVDPRLGEYERLSTAILNGYALPRAERYVDRIESWLPQGAQAYFMLSEGGVAPAYYARTTPISLIASGPAAGVLAACFIGTAAGVRNLISFDIGGTSCDVCVIRDGHPTQTDQLTLEKESIPVRMQCVDVKSIGAGGGSIAWVDEGSALRVGPRSAGANPGPACYGMGGESPTVTDANVLLGIVNPGMLLGGRLRADPKAANGAISTLQSALGVSASDIALGIYRIVNANMAQAIRTITVQKGIDPRDFTLIAFGGAGGQHAVDVAREMQIPRVLFPPHPSTFSALGLLTADLRVSRVRPVMKLLSDVDAPAADREFAILETETGEVFSGATTETREFGLQRFADLRYSGQIHTIQVPLASWDHGLIVQSFEDIHETLFGTRLGDPVEIVNLGLTRTISLPKPQLRASDRHREPEVVATSYVLTEQAEVPVIMRTSLSPGDVLPSPCLVQEEDSVLYFPSHTRATADDLGNILCEVQYA